MSKRSIALYLQRLNYGDLFKSAQSVHDGFVANVATYPAPPVSTADQQAIIDTMASAIHAWGVKGKRGSRQAHTELVDARDAVREMVKQLAHYCMSVTPNDSASWEKVGFVTRKTREPANKSQAVQDLRQVTATNIPADIIKLKWKKPLDNERRRPLDYRVLRSDSPDRDTAREVAVVTKTVFSEVVATRGVVYYYWVVPVNAYGAGVTSPGCSASTRPVG